MSHLVACILALSVLRIAPSGPVYARQLRTEGAHARAEFLAQSIDDVARLYRVDASLLLALAWHEAAFDRSRVSTVGARSIMQLNGKLASAYDRACGMMANDWACDRLALTLGARELRKGLEICGSVAGGLSWYRAGHCRGGDTWRVRQVLALRDELRWGMP